MSKKVDVRPGEGNSNFLGARPVHQTITVIKWIWSSELSIKSSLSMLCGLGFGLWGLGVGVSNANFYLERGKRDEP
jgi:hypothetical protein